MRTTVVLSIALSVLLTAIHVAAQPKSSTGEVTFSERNLSGPRMGFTYVPDDGQLSKALRRADIGRFISQFGWHFEHQVTPAGGGPSFLVEIIPLIGGVEYGQFMLSFNWMFGIRLPEGYEFGMGINVSKMRLTEGDFNSALVMAVGKTFDYGGVSIPINLAYVNSPIGTRIAFVFGYAIQRLSN